MLGCNDKITLCAINFTNKNGEIINYHLKFPIDAYFEIPEDIIQVSIFETHQGICNYGFTAFNIYVGDITTIKETIDHYNSGKGYKIIPDKIKSIDTKLCYYNDEHDNWIIFAKVNNNDVVVKDANELKSILINISNSFENLQNSINNIKNPKPKYDYNWTNEDTELSKKRYEVCVKERNKTDNFLDSIIRHNQEIDNISANYDYPNWLISFTKRYPIFSSNDWEYEQGDLTKEEIINVSKLPLFYEAIEEYASEMQLTANHDKDGDSYYYPLIYNNKGFNIGILPGQGATFYCESSEDIINGIDFNDIINYHNNRKTRIRKKDT